MTKKYISILLVAAFMMNFMLPGLVRPAYAAGYVADLEILSGTAQVKESKSSQWKDVTGKIKVSNGNFIHIPPGCSALLHLKDGSIIRLYEKSIIGIDEIFDIAGTRKYNVRFIGKLLASAVENTGDESYFITGAPTCVIFTMKGKEYSAVLNSDLFMKVDVLDGEADAQERYNVTGTVKKILGNNQGIKLELEDGKIVTVMFNPATIIKDGYAVYSGSGNPLDLADIEKLKEGEKVIVYGIPNEEGSLIDATFIGNKDLLPVALWALNGVSGLGGGMIGIVGGLAAVLLGLTMGGGECSGGGSSGGDDPPLSPIVP